MSKKQACTPATATALTAKTLMGNITVPSGVSRLDSVCGYIAGKVSLTIAEHSSGIIEVESDSFTGPQQFPLAITAMLTSGLAAHAPKSWPCDIPVKEGNVIRCYITLDATYTPAFVGRVFLGMS